jgi:nucleoside-diphosphate-sugar epimerase
MREKVLITGGAGYVGSVLVPKLVDKGYDVRVLDWMIYGKEVLDSVKDKIDLVEGDLRSKKLLERVVKGVDSVIHLAAISNDPSADMNFGLTMEVNYNATRNLLDLSRKFGIKRFIYASSSSVYGIKEEENVTENLILKPLTIYSMTKVASEDLVREYNSKDFITVNLRPATVCGYSPRQRLDVIVNIFANDAINKRVLRVDGGEQKRPNIHIEDMADYYLALLQAPEEKIAGETFNAGYENFSLAEIADITKRVVGDDVTITRIPTKDNRSYHISSEKIKKILGLEPKHTVEEAIKDLKHAFEIGLIPNPSNSIYRNIERMKELKIK